MMGQRVIVLGVAQDIGRRYEGRIIKVKKVLQVVEKKNPAVTDEIIQFSKMSTRSVFLFC